MTDNNFASKAYRSFLLWGMSTTIGSAICTFVDATLVGNYIGDDALAAVNIGTPLFLLFAVLGVTIASGSNVLIGQQLGRSNVGEANRIFGEQLTLSLILSIICTILGVIFADPILRLLGANDDIIGYAREYSMVVFASAGLFIMYQSLSFSVRSDGSPKLAAISSTVLVILNLVLDILFLGVMRTGIMGASLALCIGKAFSVAILFLHFKKKSGTLKLALRLPSLRSIAEFVKYGFGMGSMFFFQALVMGIFNQLLANSGSDGTFHVALFTIIYTMSTFGDAFFDGASIALTPVISIFFGERDRASIKQTVKEAMKWCIVASLAVALLFIVFAGGIIKFFGLGEAANLENAILAFRLYAISLLFSGVNTLLISYWQSIGKIFASTFMSILGGFVLLLLFGVVLIPKYQTIGLGLAFTLTEGVSLVITIIMYLFIDKKDKKEMSSANESQRVFERTYTISVESISEVSADIERVAEEWDIPMKTSFFVNFIIEEVTVNIMKFALGKKNKEHYIALRLTEEQGKYSLRIRDDVTDYNPFETDGDEVDNAVINMIKTKSEWYDYQRKLIFNYLYIKI